MINIPDRITQGLQVQNAGLHGDFNTLNDHKSHWKMFHKDKIAVRKCTNLCLLHQKQFCINKHDSLCKNKKSIVENPQIMCFLLNGRHCCEWHYIDEDIQCSNTIKKHFVSLWNW